MQTLSHDKDSTVNLHKLRGGQNLISDTDKEAEKHQKILTVKHSIKKW